MASLCRVGPGPATSGSGSAYCRIMASVERVEYDGDGLSESMVASTPWDQLTRWLDAAVERGRQHGDVPEPSAMG